MDEIKFYIYTNRPLIRHSSIIVLLRISDQCTLCVSYKGEGSSTLTNFGSIWHRTTTKYAHTEPTKPLFDVDPPCGVTYGTPIVNHF